MTSKPEMNQDSNDFNLAIQQIKKITLTPAEKKTIYGNVLEVLSFSWMPSFVATWVIKRKLKKSSKKLGQSKMVAH